MSQSLGEWLVTEWTARFGEIMLTMGDVQPDMNIRRTETAALPPDLFWWKQPFDCGADSIIWIGASEATRTETGKLVLVAAGVDSPPPSEIQSTYLELVRQSMSGLAQNIGQRLSQQVSCDPGAESSPGNLSSHLIFEAKADIPNGSTVVFYLVVAASMCDQIVAAERQEQTPAPQELMKSSETESAVGSRTFDLLLDVELPVSISFGRTLLKLNDALKLITGSLIELDRGLSDPVELLVNNCVIARGEVVVIEGNYGIRVTEIISQKERLQQTRRYMLH